MSKEIVLTVGLPASGKSTWAKDFCEKNLDWVRINRDDLRHMSGQYWVPKREKYITDLEQFAVGAAMKRGFNIILDATNLNPKVRVWVDKYASGHGYEVREEVFDTNVAECILRDSARENKVGSAVIMRMHNAYFNDDGTRK